MAIGTPTRTAPWTATPTPTRTAVPTTATPTPTWTATAAPVTATPTLTPAVAMSTPSSITQAAEPASCQSPPAGELGPGEWVKYYYANGKVVALRRKIGTATCLYYYLPDHLGGQHALVDAATNAVVSRQLYWPYGDRKDSNVVSATDRQYTGGCNHFL